MLIWWNDNNAQRQREQHLKERHALILRTRQQRREQEEEALKLIGRMCFDEKRITEDELDQLNKVICVEYENLCMEVLHHENLYLGLSDEADKAIMEISDEEFALAEREEHWTVNVECWMWNVPHSTFNTDILGFPTVTSSKGAFISQNSVIIIKQND